MRSTTIDLVKDVLREVCYEISDTEGYRGMGIPTIAKRTKLGSDRLYKIVNGKAGINGIPFEVYHKISKKYPYVRPKLRRLLL